MIRTDRLDSGLTVVTETMSEARSVCIGFWVGTGSRDESSDLAGSSHFLEHLLFKGTEERSASAIAVGSLRQSSFFFGTQMRPSLRSDSDIRVSFDW